MNTDITIEEERREYRDHVKIIADSIQEELQREPDADVHRMLHEDVESSSYVINYNDKTKVIRHTKQRVNQIDFPTEGLDTDEIFTRRVFELVRMDVIEELRNLGVQV